MTGRPIAVVGPSGVGKDSVMAALAGARPGLLLARRRITRDAQAGGEPFVPLTAAAFDAQRAAGDFVLHWQAHGLRYGISATVEADMVAGHDVAMNLSRRVLDAAARHWPGLVVLSLTASAGVLAQRLAGRGREDAGAIAARLARPAPPLPPGLSVHVIDNSGPLAASVAAALAALYPVSAAR